MTRETRSAQTSPRYVRSTNNSARCAPSLDEPLGESSDDDRAFVVIYGEKVASHARLNHARARANVRYANVTLHKFPLLTQITQLSAESPRALSTYSASATSLPSREISNIRSNPTACQLPPRSWLINFRLFIPWSLCIARRLRNERAYTVTLPCLKEISSLSYFS